MKHRLQFTILLVVAATVGVVTAQDDPGVREAIRFERAKAVAAVR